MRLKEERSNWNASSVVRRNVRHDKSTQEVPRHRAKKDKKKWCGGRVGKKHKVVYREYKKYSGHSFMKNRPPWMEIACEECGKHFASDFGFFGRPKKGREKMLEEWRKKLDL